MIRPKDLPLLKPEIPKPEKNKEKLKKKEEKKITPSPEKKKKKEEKKITPPPAKKTKIEKNKPMECNEEDQPLNIVIYDDFEGGRLVKVCDYDGTMVLPFCSNCENVNIFVTDN